MKIKLLSVIQVPYSSTFVKITAVHMLITFASKVFFFKLRCPKLGCTLDSMAHYIRINMVYSYCSLSPKHFSETCFISVYIS